MLKKIFGSRNDRLVKAKRKIVAKINALEDAIKALSDEELKGKTEEFRTRLKEGVALNDLLPEVFAVVREASQRVLGMRHYDVQLIGGMVLNDGKIAEMKTGEGKTLVATLAVYLNALPSQGVHVVTVNDYLAQRDAQWMGRVYEYLGMSVGVIMSGLEPEERKAAYAADITYATNNELGFDFLRDNIAFMQEQKVQRGHAFAIVDEVDSILIDEARTPLIISGQGEEKTKIYTQLNSVIPKLKRQETFEGVDADEVEPEHVADFTVDEKSKSVYLTEQGHQNVEALLIERGVLTEEDNLYDAKNIRLVHYVNALLKAHHLFQRDVDYVVQNNEIVIVDEFTGRALPGRRWGDGLHQAVEAKEGLNIQSESQTLASITFQNYFRMYGKLAGMTGTADTEAYEFQQIYGLEVVVIPTHRAMSRKDYGDAVYLSMQEKYNAIVEDIKDCYERSQPVLVGTASIESSELLSKALKQNKIPHEVLNAKQHAREAHIVAQAGRPKAVTIATNMAGRGTDIVLGGNFDAEIAALKTSPDEEKINVLKEAWQQRHNDVLESGGLHVVGTERHESRRVDNQLRGRSGRQGDPGSSRFYLSMEDNLMRIFASEKVAGMMKKLGLAEGESIEHPWVTKAIGNAQRKVEGHNFEIRKQLIEYDDVSNEQRKVIFEMRSEIMDNEHVSDMVQDMWDEVFNAFIDRFVPPQSLFEQWDVSGLKTSLQSEFGLTLPLDDWLDADENLHEETLRERIIAHSREVYEQKMQGGGAEMMRHFEKQVVLRVLDTLWREHLSVMEHLRESIYLRSYAQKNPKHEFQSEAFKLFTDLLDRIRHESVSLLSKVQVTMDESGVGRGFDEEQEPMVARHESLADGHNDQQDSQDQQPFVRTKEKVGRNKPCPCGSGKKFKHCHGRLSATIE